MLLPHIMLDFDHSEPASVEDVLTQPDEFIGETLADPLEGAGYGHGKAIILRSKTEPQQIVINSFAHGHAFYRSASRCGSGAASWRRRNSRLLGFGSGRQWGQAFCDWIQRRELGDRYGSGRLCDDGPGLTPTWIRDA